MRQSLNIAGVFAAIVLGAGFASGQELLSFFVVFGKAGFWGIAAAGLVFALVGCAVMDLCYCQGIKSYGEFSENIMGRDIGRFMENVISLFLFVLFATMLSASGAAFDEGFGLPAAAGTGLMCALCIGLFFGGLPWIVRLSAVLAPIMIIGGVFIGLFAFVAEPVFLRVSVLRQNHWLVSAVVYASYNIITAVTVLAAMGGDIPNRKTAFIGPALGALAVTALGLCMSLPLFTRFIDISAAELPLLRLASEHGSVIKGIYLAVLISAIATTAAANGFAFAQWVSRRFGVPPALAKVGVCLCGFFFARVGFSNFVGIIYPAFGYIGVFQILVILGVWCALLFGRASRKASKGLWGAAPNPARGKAP